jgi:hypothetical protein
MRKEPRNMPNLCLLPIHMDDHSMKNLDVLLNTRILLEVADDIDSHYD